jgi:phosphoserine aminotransferase
LNVVDERVRALKPAEQAAFAKNLVGLLERERVALDAASYRSAPPGLRIWCGATIELSDVTALTPWLDWAFATVLAELKRSE